MKKLIFAITIAFTANSYAFFNMPSNLDYPSENDWAVAMVSMACGQAVTLPKGTVATISEIEGGILYTATVKGKTVAKVTAANTSVFAKKTCYLPKK